MLSFILVHCVVIVIQYVMFFYIVLKSGMKYESGYLQF